MSVLTHTSLEELASQMELVFDLLDLLAGKGYPAFFGPQSYLEKVKDYHDGLDASGQAFLKAMLVWLRDGEMSPRIVALYRDCVKDKQAEVRQWLDSLKVQMPAEIMTLLTEPPTEEKCRQRLKEHAAYALELLNETEVDGNEEEPRPGCDERRGG
jgi:hypothetical protein